MMEKIVSFNSNLINEVIINYYSSINLQRDDM
jgi:hypothetical protein